MRKIYRHKEAEKENHDRWLLTYADMITLLLGLFIILYSISKVDSAKLKNVAKMVRSGFGIIETESFDGGSGFLEDEDYLPRSPIYRLWERIGYALKKLRESSKLMLGLANTEEIKLVLFTSALGNNLIKPDADTEFALQKIAELSKAMDVDIILRVQIPYSSNEDKTNFNNNWDYHANRASLWAKYISTKYQIPESQLIVEGLAEFRQLKTSTGNPEDKAKQERIEIIIRSSKEK